MIQPAQILFTLAPISLAGILNMAWVKAPILNSLKVPMDAGLKAWDGKRWFGDNKTWKGFIGMPIFTAFFTTALGYVTHHFEWAAGLFFIPFESLGLRFPYVSIGLLWGLGYVLAELPNSFIKRRLKISSGTNGHGALGAFFVLVDQADSAIGCVLITLPFYVFQFSEAISLIGMATVIHLLLNMSLYAVGLRNQIA